MLCRRFDSPSHQNNFRAFARFSGEAEALCCFGTLPLRHLGVAIFEATGMHKALLVQLHTRIAPGTQPPLRPFPAVLCRFFQRFATRGLFRATLQGIQIRPHHDHCMGSGDHAGVMAHSLARSDSPLTPLNEDCFVVRIQCPTDRYRYTRPCSRTF